MPSDSVAAFLALAREYRLLPAADLARLLDRPEDGEELPALCDRLVADGLLTRYQADRIRTGRGYALSFAGYPLLDELPSPAGRPAYKAADPTTRTPVVLRRLPPAGPDERSVASDGVNHPAVLVPLDAGEVWGERYVVHPMPDGADLGTLVAEMGPMPSLLAVEYARQAAVGLAAAHAAGVVHGDVRPEGLFVGPLVQASRPKADGSLRYRPAPSAAVTVSDLGLPPPAVGPNAPHRPPEGTPSPAGDVYMLGGVLFFMLTGRPPGSAPLSVARPDCPPEVVTVVKGLLALDPAARPTMAGAVNRLAALVAPAVAPLVPGRDSDTVPLGQASNAENVLPNVQLAETEQLELVGDTPRLAMADGWAGHPAMQPAPPPAYTPAAWEPSAAVAVEDEPDLDDPTPRRSRRKPAARGGSRKMLWLLAGAFVAINLLAVLVWALMIANPFGSPATRPGKSHVGRAA